MKHISQRIFLEKVFTTRARLNLINSDFGKPSLLLRNIAYSFLILYSLFQGISVTCLAAEYPMEIKIVRESEAKYNSPENTYIAMISSLFHEDIDWYFRTLTKESAEKEINLQLRYNYGPEEIFDSVKNINKIIITDQKPYKNGALLIVKTINNDGSIIEGPSIFVQENGLWKSSQETLLADDPVLDYLEYTPPPQHLTPFELSVHPSEWPLSWYAWFSEYAEMNDHPSDKSEKITVLCAISDEVEDDVTITDILPETLKLNDKVIPQPWHYFTWGNVSQAKGTSIILPPGGNLPITDSKGFKHWYSRKNLRDSKPVMLVRFNLYQAMQTLSDLKAGEVYDVVVSGKLKNDKPFKTTAKISIITSTDQPKKNWRWWRQKPPHQDKMLEHWWNR